jgi:hypothetical protein
MEGQQLSISSSSRANIIYHFETFLDYAPLLELQNGRNFMDIPFHNKYLIAK